MICDPNYLVGREINSIMSPDSMSTIFHGKNEKEILCEYQQKIAQKKNEIQAQYLALSFTKGDEQAITFLFDALAEA